jgi:hypothetical protein
MHIPTHILSGWCAGNLVRFSPRERLFCMIAASIADIDGCGIVMGGTEQDWYWRFHHVLAHNVFFGLMIAGIFAIFSPRRWFAFFFYLLCFHLHLIMDFFGSGPGWTIAYWWPLSTRGYKTDYCWPLFSWQNMVAFAVLLAWTVAIAKMCRHTPLELIAPRLDQACVARLGGARGTEFSIGESV